MTGIKHIEANYIIYSSILSIYLSLSLSLSIYIMCYIIHPFWRVEITWLTPPSFHEESQVQGARIKTNRGKASIEATCRAAQRIFLYNVYPKQHVGGLIYVVSIPII